MASVARELHRFGVVVFVVAGLILLAGCPPPPLQLDQADAGQNVAPTIMSVKGPDGEEFPHGAENATLIQGADDSMTITIADADFEDTLYVRAFVDYDQDAGEVSFRAQCEAAPPTPRTLERTASCRVDVVCTVADVDGARHVLDVWAFDREPEGVGFPPPNLAVLPPGLKSPASFGLTCLAGPI